MSLFEWNSVAKIGLHFGVLMGANLDKQTQGLTMIFGKTACRVQWFCSSLIFLVLNSRTVKTKT